MEFYLQTDCVVEILAMDTKKKKLDGAVNVWHLKINADPVLILIKKYYTNI